MWGTLYRDIDRQPVQVWNNILAGFLTNSVRKAGKMIDDDINRMEFHEEEGNGRE